MVRLMAFWRQDSWKLVLEDSVLCAALLWVLSSCPGQRLPTLVVSLEAILDGWWRVIHLVVDTDT